MVPPVNKRAKPSANCHPISGSHSGTEAVRSPVCSARTPVWSGAQEYVFGYVAPAAFTAAGSPTAKPSYEMNSCLMPEFDSRNVAIFEAASLAMSVGSTVNSFIEHAGQFFLSVLM